MNILLVLFNCIRCRSSGMLLSYAVDRGTQKMWDHLFSLCYVEIGRASKDLRGWLYKGICTLKYLKPFKAA
jgi:hypothetical protein